MRQDIVATLNSYRAHQKAMVAFNAPDFAAMVGIAKAAYQLRKPVIIQTSARLVKRTGAKTLKQWFETARAITGGPCYLHLDHCDDTDLIADCIHNGWDMVMFDGSHMPIADNCAKLRQIVTLAHAHNVAVEGEVGPIGGEEDGRSAIANAATAEDIVQLGKTGIDCIAVGFGNVHGAYNGKSHLRWDIYEAAYDLCALPLVLHGGSGLTAGEFARAIRCGTAKINISTDLKNAYFEIVNDQEMRAKVAKDPAILQGQLEQAAMRLALSYITLFSE